MNEANQTQKVVATVVLSGITVGFTASIDPNMEKKTAIIHAVTVDGNHIPFQLFSVMVKELVDSVVTTLVGQFPEVFEGVEQLGVEVPDELLEQAKLQAETVE